MEFKFKDQKISGHDERALRRQPPTFERLEEESLRSESNENFINNAVIHCGWGRLLLGHTFSDTRTLVKKLSNEAQGERDIAIYVDEPHVALNHAPQNLFLDPSDIYRLWFDQYRQSDNQVSNVVVRRATSEEDLDEINRIYLKRSMLPIQKKVFMKKRLSKYLYYFIAEIPETGEIVGTVMGVNHIKACKDPSNGSSLWCLAVLPDSPVPGVGEALVRFLCEYFHTRGCEYIDLSVMCDNLVAKKLYEKIGFRKIKSFTLKTKNAINEKLFVGNDVVHKFNPYAQILVDEALKRGIEVIVDSVTDNRFTLSFGGRKIRCHESLTDLTTAYSMILCQDKMKTYEILKPHNINIPIFSKYNNDNSAIDFLKKHSKLVVKPTDCEQGQGVFLDIDNEQSLLEAISEAKSYSTEIMLETYHEGIDLRVVVIGYEVVAAAIRKPAHIIGDAKHNIKELIIKQSRRRSASTGGESKIPIDDETHRCIKQQGYSWTSVLEKGEKLQVRKTANLHTGGSLIDVTEQLNDTLKEQAMLIAKIIQIPVVGLDFIVSSPDDSDFVFIEANERPGLANHEPQPTAKKFIDLLFPLSH